MKGFIGILIMSLAVGGLLSLTASSDPDFLEKELEAAEPEATPGYELFPDYTIPGLDKTITIVPDFDLAGTTTAVWLTHAGFALPFAI